MGSKYDKTDMINRKQSTAVLYLYVQNNKIRLKSISSNPQAQCYCPFGSVHCNVKDDTNSEIINKYDIKMRSNLNNAYQNVTVCFHISLHL